MRGGSRRGTFARLWVLRACCDRGPVALRWNFCRRADGPRPQRVETVCGVRMFPGTFVRVWTPRPRGLSSRENAEGSKVDVGGKSAPVPFLRGYEFCQRGALEHSGRSCRTDGSGGTLRTCWSANQQVGFRAMLEKMHRSYSPFLRMSTGAKHLHGDRPAYLSACKRLPRFRPSA